MSLRLNNLFIEEHMAELIQLEDYLPFSLVQWDKQYERDDFLKSKNLLTTLQEMDELLRQKCEHYKDSEEAYDSILIEWIDCHPEFEGILTPESFENHQKIKEDENSLHFLDLLYDVELPSEKKEWIPPKESIRDDSSIQLPDFEKKKEIFDGYGATLLACYLSYLV